MPKKNNPGCGCCCSICSDPFTRDDSSDISTGSPCGWTEDSGAWDITSNQLRCTTAGVAHVTTAHPDGDITMTVQVDFKHDTSGSACDVIVGWVDTSNWYYVRYKVQGGSGSVDIRKNVAGVHSSIKLQSSVTINTGTTYTARVCVTASGGISAYLNSNLTTLFGAAVTGTMCALGSNGSGIATFDTFSFYKSFAAGSAITCDHCGSSCTGCINSASPNFLKIVVDGVVNAACSDCDSYNGTFYVPLIIGAGCVWVIENVSSCPNFGINGRYYIGQAPGSDISVILEVATMFPNTIRWIYFGPADGASVDTCLLWANENFPYNSANSSTVSCNGTAATCLVTSM